MPEVRKMINRDRAAKINMSGEGGYYSGEDPQPDPHGGRPEKLSALVRGDRRAINLETRGLAEEKSRRRPGKNPA